MRFLRRSLIGVFLLASTVALLTVAGSTIYSAVQDSLAETDARRSGRERVFTVTVTPVEVGPATPVLTAFGELRSTQALDVRAKLPGTVIKLHPAFEEGGQVNRGDLLLRVDQADAQAALAVARADLAEAETEAEDARISLQLAGDDVQAAREQAALREQALQRQQSLRTRGFGADAQVEEAELAAASARQVVLARRQALASAETRVSQSQINLRRRNIALADAERALADTEIYAEFSGTLSGVSLVRGGLVAANEQLAQLIAEDALEVSFRLSTAQYARLIQGGALSAARVRVVLSADGFELQTGGAITREAAVVAEGQSGRLLFARLDDSAGFRPGDFVSVRVDEPALRAATVLPAAALGSDGKVLVLGDGERLESAPVQLLRRQGDQVIVAAQALAGREVVSARTPLLGPGIKVRVVRPLPDGAAPPAPQMVALSEARRDKLIAFVEANKRMPDEIKQRILSQLSKPEVPANVIERLESRMGG